MALTAAGTPSLGLIRTYSALSSVLDFAAALSCEAARADISSLDAYLSSDVRDEKDVARDLKTLLFSSKLTGHNHLPPFSDIPAVHGALREAIRSVGLRKAPGPTAFYLAAAIESTVKSSVGRLQSLSASATDAEVRTMTEEVVRSKFDVEDLVYKYGRISGGVNVVLGLLVDKLRMAVAWEMAVAMWSLEEGEKKKKTMGRGTDVLKDLLRQMIGALKADAFAGRAMKLYADLGPEGKWLWTLADKVKEVVQSNEARRLPKIPKGTRDFGKDQMAIRERAFSKIQRVFKRHGATGLDTPDFELRETLMGKYGEDSKLIYDLADQGGELCSLRYDLTVPFARYLAMNNMPSMKRYQIGKVHRRDNPSKGRFREFYQCDFDIAGEYGVPMGPDFEVIRVLVELLTELNIGDFEIKVNHRKMLDGILDICGVPSEKFRTVCSSIDKLDKQPFEQIRKELVDEKGLSFEVVDKIGSFVSKRGHPKDVISDLKKDGSPFLGSEECISALKDLGCLFDALEKAKSLDKISFDLSLARGLDYYTGVIFEAVTKGSAQIGIGSIGAGGRYDNLVGMFSEKKVPCVGVSLGIERVFAIMEGLSQSGVQEKIRPTETQVLVAGLGPPEQYLGIAVELAAELWDMNIAAEFGVHKKVRKHIDRALENEIPFMVIVGDLEREKGVVKLKDMKANKEDEVKADEIIQVLQERMLRYTTPDGNV